MQLVMRRQRVASKFRPFVINARIELDRDENSLLISYRLKNVVLTPGNKRRDVRRAVIFGAIVAFFVTPPALATFAASSIPNIVLGFGLIFALASVMIYHQIREEVHVNDLITGRDFKARSFLDLLEKEQMIRQASHILAYVVEQARTWHEPEVIALAPQSLMAVLQGGQHEALGYPLDEKPRPGGLEGSSLTTSETLDREAATREAS